MGIPIAMKINIELYPTIKAISWNPYRPNIIPGDEALALYERNYRFFDESELSTDEADLLERLMEIYPRQDFSSKEVIGREQRGKIYSIGHSNVPFSEFYGRLKEHGISAIADVRSKPYSQYLPQFNREDMAIRLKGGGIRYVYLGAELGGRPNDPSLYRDGHADYFGMSKTETFKNGIARLISGAAKFKLAMMCSERDPSTCHRCLLIGRFMADNGVDVQHIEKDQVKSQFQVEQSLIERLTKRRRDGSNLPPFDPDNPELIDLAYNRQASISAYKLKDASPSENANFDQFDDAPGHS